MRQLIIFLLLFYSAIFSLAASPRGATDRERRAEKLARIAATSGTLPAVMPDEELVEFPEGLYQSLVAEGRDNKEAALRHLPGAADITWLLATDDISPLLAARGMNRWAIVEYGAVAADGTFLGLMRSMGHRGFTVRRAHQNHILTTDTELTNDPLVGEQWHLNNIEVSAFWNAGVTTSRFPVAVFDSGVQGNHEDLASSVNHELSATFLGGRADALVDQFFHATHVGGTACATANNQLGVSGVMQKCDLISLQVIQAVYSNRGQLLVSGTEDSLIAALLYLYGKVGGTFAVANMSLGASNVLDAEAMLTAIKAVADRILVVAAAGNNGSQNADYPARWADETANVLAVGSVAEDGSPSWFSNKGKGMKNFISAPGERICSTEPAGYACGAGTSYAAPQVAALAAMVAERMAQNGASPTPETVRELLLKGAVVNPALAVVEADGMPVFGTALVANARTALATVDAAYPAAKTDTAQPDTPAAAPAAPTLLVAHSDGSEISNSNPLLAGETLTVYSQAADTRVFLLTDATNGIWWELPATAAQSASFQGWWQVTTALAGKDSPLPTLAAGQYILAVASGATVTKYTVILGG